VARILTCNHSRAAARVVSSNHSHAVARYVIASRALLEASGSGWLHAYVPRVLHDDSILAELRSRMGDAAFEEAWDWGGSIGGRRAVEFALEQGNPA
jgi:hypothetical protein